MTVRRSLDQQEEYRVRDTAQEPRGGREPVTEAGRRLLAGEKGQLPLAGCRDVPTLHDLILAIEAEAALLARPVRETHEFLPSAESPTSCARAVGTDYGPCQLPEANPVHGALLARRAPGDRPGVHATPDSPRARRTPWGYTDDPAGSYVVLYDPLLADRALAADSRPEQQK